jgi:hypothetical protein
MNKHSHEHSWKFQRIGGVDQVVLNTADDIAHLEQLDPKLWVALSCPTLGLELNSKMLTLLDTDGDQRIRIQDIINAVNWLRTKLVKLDSLIESNHELPLSAINTDNDEGKRLLNTAQSVLKNINKAEASSINEEDIKQSTLLNASNIFNGDGILPPNPKLDDELVAYINDALNVMGGVKDISGVDGINTDISKAFIQSIDKWLKWHNGVGSATTPLGENTAEVWQLIQSIKDKCDDYFMRTQLASYAPNAQAALNVDEKFIVPSDNGLLEDKALSELPLSRIEADKPLNLKLGLNPVWRPQIERFKQLVEPFLADANQLTQDEWHYIQQIMAPYAIAVQSKPTLEKVSVTTEPKITIDKLGEKRINEILNSQLADRFAELAERDSKTPASAANVAALEQLVVYHANLYHLLLNFTSFHDFFDLDRRAAFQYGQLFIDGRCCSLCIPVTDVGKHTVLANYSELFLLYCECIRKKPADDGSELKRTIVAAMTSGDADFLIEGRNGVFLDSEGNDWDARVIKIISKPISISQAIWDPYKRLGRFITDQINKWAGSKDQQFIDATTKATQNLATTTDTAPPKFDIGRSAGIFAAIGLAVGAIGTALASIAQSLLSLHWWQLPLVFVGLFLFISGPSVIMAWLKLRQRTLGPLLEASGWAINGRLKINLFLGGQLTTKATLPKHASRTLVDPMKKRNRKYWLIFWLAIITGIVISGAWIWHYDHWHIRTQLGYKAKEPHHSASTDAEKSSIPTSPSGAAE